MKTIKYKNKYLSCIQKQFSKFAVFLVIASMLFGTLGINPTSAYFSDTATISGNTFTAGTLAFHLNPATDFTPSTLNKGETASLETTIVKEDESLDFQYTVATTDMTGNTDLCNALTLQATNDTYTYNDTLTGFSAPAQNYADPSAWNFVVTLPSGATDSLQDKTCNFKFTFSGWQEGLSSTEGFSDTKQISGSITSGHWAVPVISSVVLNEILPNPEGLDTQLGLQGEWVELYNNGNTSVELADWKIKDAAGNIKIISSSNTFNGRTLIGKKGSGLEWVVVFMNDAVLDDSGDTVYLKDQANNTIDQYPYGNSGNDDDSDSNFTGGGSNSNASGSETTGNEGKSDARIPDGADNWIDPIPTPGMPNELAPIIVTTTAEIVTTGSSNICTPDEASVIEPAEIAPVEEAPVTEPEEVVTEKEVVETPVASEPTVEPASTLDSGVATEPAPVVEAPVVEATVVEALVVEAPVVETPAVEVPATE